MGPGIADPLCQREKQLEKQKVNKIEIKITLKSQ